MSKLEVRQLVPIISHEFLYKPNITKLSTSNFPRPAAILNASRSPFRLSVIIRRLREEPRGDASHQWHECRSATLPRQSGGEAFPAGDPCCETISRLKSRAGKVVGESPNRPYVHTDRYLYDNVRYHASHVIYDQSTYSRQIFDFPKFGLSSDSILDVVALAPQVPTVRTTQQEPCVAE